MKISRRSHLKHMGNLLGLTLLGGTAVRLFSPPDEEAEFIPQNRRFSWQIDPEKCQYCGLCATACVRTPSAVKAVNDQKKCSNCVACYGHISDSKTPSEKIDSDGARVCPYDAVVRENFSGGSDGMFLYSNDPARCVGCARCVARCNEMGNRSMFMIIRPDLCLGCNECSIAKVCPAQAIERIPREPADDFRGDYLLESEDFYDYGYADEGEEDA
jgi:electron transport complex protein RnfB